MEIALRFRILSDENDDFIRDYEVPYKMTLLEFHDFISKDLGYDNSNVTSFYTSDREWNKLEEYTSVDMGLDDGDMDSMADVTLSEVVQNNNDRLIFEFDMLGDRSLYLELTGSDKAEKVKPKVLLSQGSAPHQFDPADAVIDASIFADMMEEFADFSGDDFSEDDF